MKKIVIKLSVSLAAAFAAAGACLFIPFKAVNTAAISSMSFGWPFKSLFQSSNVVINEYRFPLYVFPWASGSETVSFNVGEFLLSAAFFFVVFAAVVFAVSALKRLKK